MKNIKNDIFNTNMSYDEIIKKYNFNTINTFSEIKTLNNICYFNNSVNKVNTYIHKKVLNYKEDYFLQLNIKCRKFIQLQKGKKLNTNYVYKIVGINKNIFTIVNELENKFYDVDIKTIRENFKYTYCSTIDSIQGKSISDKITIFDWDLGYMSRRKIWTAITRARNLNDITFFINSENTINSFKESKYKQYFRFKVESYKIQDKNKNRSWEIKEYVNEEWISEQFEKSSQCPLCFKSYELFINDNNNVISDLTVDRIDNNLPHIKTNCRLLCHHCNISKK